MNIIFGMFSYTARPKPLPSAAILRQASRSPVFGFLALGPEADLEVFRAAGIVHEPLHRRDLLGRHRAEVLLEFGARPCAVRWSGMRLTISSTMRCRSGSSFGAAAGVFGVAAPVPPSAGVPGAGTPSSRCGRRLLAGPSVQVRAAIAVVADVEIQRVARVAAAERRQQEEGDAQDQVHAERRRIVRAPPAQELDGERAGPEGERLQRAPDARVEVRDVAQQVAHQRAERQHPDLRALAAVRTVLAAQHLAAVEAVLGRERAADEFLAVRQDPPFGGVAVAELLDALRAHARRVLAQVRVERGPVAQPVLDDAADPAGRRRGSSSRISADRKPSNCSTSAMWSRSQVSNGPSIAASASRLTS